MRYLAIQGEEVDYDESLRRRVAVLKGLPESALERLYTERVRLSPGDHLGIARAVGVRRPELIRLALVEATPPACGHTSSDTSTSTKPRARLRHFFRSTCDSSPSSGTTMPRSRSMPARTSSVTSRVRYGFDTRSTKGQCHER